MFCDFGTTIVNIICIKKINTENIKKKLISFNLSTQNHKKLLTDYSAHILLLHMKN